MRREFRAIPRRQLFAKLSSNRGGSNGLHTCMSNASSSAARLSVALAWPVSAIAGTNARALARRAQGAREAEAVLFRQCEHRARSRRGGALESEHAPRSPTPPTTCAPCAAEQHREQLTCVRVVVQSAKTARLRATVGSTRGVAAVVCTPWARANGSATVTSRLALRRGWSRSSSRRGLRPNIERWPRPRPRPPPRARANGCPLGESVEEQRQERSGDASSVIDDRGSTRGPSICVETVIRPPGSELDRVVQQIRHNLLQPAASPDASMLRRRARRECSGSWRSRRESSPATAASITFSRSRGEKSNSNLPLIIRDTSTSIRSSGL